MYFKFAYYLHMTPDVVDRLDATMVDEMLILLRKTQQLEQKRRADEIKAMFGG